MGRSCPGATTGLRLGFPALGSGPCQDKERPYTRHHAAPAKPPAARAPPQWAWTSSGVPRPPGHRRSGHKESICRSCPKPRCPLPSLTCAAGSHARVTLFPLVKRVGCYSVGINQGVELSKVMGLRFWPPAWGTSLPYCLMSLHLCSTQSLISSKEPAQGSTPAYSVTGCRGLSKFLEPLLLASLEVTFHQTLVSQAQGTWFCCWKVLWNWPSVCLSEDERGRNHASGLMFQFSLIAFFSLNYLLVSVSASSLYFTFLSQPRA